MRLLEIQREMNLRRKFSDGPYTITVNLENAGEAHECLKVHVMEGEDVVARAIFKQWNGNARWEPLNLNVREQDKKNTLKGLMYEAAKYSGFIIEDNGQ